MTDLSEWLQSVRTEDSEDSALSTDAVVDEVSALWMVIWRVYGLQIRLLQVRQIVKE